MKKFQTIIAVSLLLSSCSNPFDQSSTSFVTKDTGERTTANTQNQTPTSDDQTGKASPTSMKLTAAFSQGGPGASHSETFIQDGSRKGVLDILVVVDNSGSMSDEQVNLAGKLSPLLSAVNHSDWQIGVVTTDPKNGCLRRLIKKNDLDAAKAFADAVQAGTSGSGNERGILMSVLGLRGTAQGLISDPNCAAVNPWLRAESTVAVLIVSDEDNCSNGNDCGNDPWAKNEYLLDYLASIRKVGKDAKVFGLITPPGAVCNGKDNKVGNQYAALINSTGGIYGNICEADYTNTLNAISNSAAEILKNQFVLSSKPDEGSVKMLVNDVEWTNGFSVSEATVTFTQVPAPGSVVKVSYSTGAQPILKSFALSGNPIQGSIIVKVNGVNLSAAEFTYDPASNSVSASIPNYAEVRIEFDSAVTATPNSSNVSTSVFPEAAP